MKVHTELFGGPEDGKPIELDNTNMPIEIKVPMVANLTMALEDELEFGDPTQPFTMKQLSYKLNKDGKYWINND